MTAATVSAAYIDGIRDERALLRQMQAAGEDVSSMAPEILRNIESTLKGFTSGPVAESLRGGRDFWRNQIRKGVEA